MTPRQIKLVRWGMFGVLLSLLPLAGAFVGSAIYGKLVSLEGLLSRGELLLIATTLAAAATGELFGSRHSSTASGTEVLAGGAAIFVAVLAIFSYAVVSTAISRGEQFSKTFVTWYSIVIWLFSIAAGALCVALSER